MVEALGLASAIASLVTLVGQVTKLSYVFLSDIKNASKSQKLYLQETSALTEVLLRMDQAFEVQEATFVQSSISNKSLQDCQKLLISLKTSLEKATERNSRIEKLKSSLRWPFDEKEVKHHVEMLRRFRDMFFASLSSDTFVVSVATYQKVDQLSQDLTHRRILESLSNPAPPRSSAVLLESVCPGTGQWFLAQKEYLEWRDRGSLLWCYGKPGVGKTIITSMILTDLRDLRWSRTRYLLYHFFDFAERKTETTASILRSFLRQVLHNADPKAISLLEGRLESVKNPSPQELSKLLLDVVSTKTDTYLLIDALDEFDDRMALIRILHTFAEAGVHVFVASRDMPDIRDSFQGERNLEIEASRSDLETYVAMKLQESDNFDSLESNTVIVSAIVDQAGGIFLLAQLLTKRLLDLTTIKQMRQALNSMPSNLAEAYESSWQRIRAQTPSRAKLATRVIGWIAHAERRLKIDELRHALAVEEEFNEIDPENITSVKVILKVCVGLVSIDSTDHTIGMIHITAYDYFGNLQDDQLPSDIQLDIAKTSISYLGFRPLCDGACTSVEQLRNRFRDMPFLRYAAEHWGDHASKVERELGSQINRLLNDSGLRASSFQAVQFQELGDQKLVEATFESLPNGLMPLHVAAFWNLSITARSFLEDGTDPNTLDTQGWTPLHWACSRGCEDVTELLLEHHAEINARDHSGWTPLFWATIKGRKQVVVRLLQENANHLLTDVNKWTVLHWAASKGDTAIINMLLQHHSQFAARQKPAKIFIKDVTMERAQQLYKSTERKNSSKAALEIAADRQDKSTFNMILECLAAGGSTEGFNELWTQRGFTEPRVSIPWRVLSKSDHFDKKGLKRWDINDHSGSSMVWKSRLLHGSIRDGKMIIVKLLIELGADIQARLYNKTPLHQAAFLEDPEISKILLLNGADTTATTSEGFTALHLAVACGNERTVDALLSGGASGDVKDHGGRTSLLLACENVPRNEDPSLQEIPVKMVNILIDHGADVHSTDDHGRNALHLTLSRSPDVQIIKLLIESGVDASAPNMYGDTPLHCFCRGFRQIRGKVEPHLEETFDLLLAHSPPEAENLEVRTKDYLSEGTGIVETPMSVAIESENWPAFHLLLAKGAKLHTTRPPDDLLWKAAYHWALQPKAVEMILALGASATVKHYGYRPMGHEAIEGLLNDKASAESPLGDFKAILKLYMDAGLDINATDNENKTLLHITASRVDDVYGAALTQHLIDVGADAYQPVCEAWDAFLLAAVHGKFEVLRVLLSHAAKTPNPGHWLKSPILEECHSSDDSILSLICSSLSHHSLLNTQNAGSLNPLQVAVSLSNASMVSTLLSYTSDSDLQITDRSGWSLLHTATFNESLPLVELLLNAGLSANCTTTHWSHTATSYSSRPSGLSAGYPWTGTPLHLAAMMGQPDIVAILLKNGADVRASTGTDGGSWPGPPGHGPTALHIALDTGKFYGERTNLGTAMLRAAEMLVESGAEVTGVADHITVQDVLKFKGFKGLWEKLRVGITGKGRSMEMPGGA